MTISTINIPMSILSEDNYENWHSQIKTFLQLQDLWNVVHEEFIMLENQATFSAVEKKKFKEEQQRNYIALCFL
ncbi:hypothetical protein AHAS_Ahas20G0090900 [Arachis hypogaea]